jgi:hypothetical protein
MKTWEKPEFVELCMNAEIGAYQEDTDREADVPPVLAPQPVGEQREASRSEMGWREHVA